MHDTTSSSNASARVTDGFREKSCTFFFFIPPRESDTSRGAVGSAATAAVLEDAVVEKLIVNDGFCSPGLFAVLRHIGFGKRH
jgi:hypothetical protein